MKNSKKDLNFFKSKGFLMLIVLFIFILVMSFFFGDSGIIEIIKAQDRIKNLKSSITGLEMEKEKLNMEIAELKNNPLALERKAREKLWLMKKNEKVIVIVRNKDKKKDNHDAGNR